MRLLDDVIAVLERGAADTTGGGEHGGFTLLEHGLQCAAGLRLRRPADLELQVAGLVHDVGQTLTGNDMAQHGLAAARFVRPVFGPRVAALVELHVPAKRYLASVDPSYRDRLSDASQESLLAQGDLMSAVEIRRFRARPEAADAVVLRRADDEAKVAGARVPTLIDWLPALRAIAGFHATSANPS